MSQRKLKRLLISPDMLLSLFTAGKHPGGYEVIEDAVPEDAQLVNVRHGWPNCIELLISSESFPELPEPPYINPKLRKTEPGLLFHERDSKQ